MKISGKAAIIAALCAGLIGAQSFAQREHKDEKPQNLKILPQEISEEQLHKVMREFSMSLGVHCNYCHESHEVPGKERPDMNFASDAKKEKQIARDMMRMTEAINEQYIGKIDDGKLDRITCVTCHNGSAHPVVDVKNLKKETGQQNAPPPPLRH